MFVAHRDDYFMSVAFLSSMRSKVRNYNIKEALGAFLSYNLRGTGPIKQDPSTQVGATIVNAENRIIGIGYNGFPTGCSDDQLPWNREAEDSLDTKYMYVVHAEMNAILNKISASVSGARMYVALFPCNECAKLIIQSGIKEVIYLSDKYHSLPSFVASRRMFAMAGVATRQHSPANPQIVIDFGSSVKSAEPAAEEAAAASLTKGKDPAGSPASPSKSSSSSSAVMAAADEDLAVPGNGWKTNT